MISKRLPSCNAGAVTEFQLSRPPNGFLDAHDTFFFLIIGHTNLPMQTSKNSFKRIKNLHLIAYNSPTSWPYDAIHLHNYGYRLLAPAKPSIRNQEESRQNLKAYFLILTADGKLVSIFKHVFSAT